MTITVLDNMEYGSDAAAQAGYTTNGIVSSDQYTKLLLHFNGENNSTVFENSASDTGIFLSGSGDVKLDTSKYKFGVSSCKFDGAGDYLTVPYNSQLDFGTGDFSISMWFWWNSAGYQFLCGTGTTGGMMLALNYNNQANQIGLGRHNVLWDTIFYADAIPTSQWNYITVERKSGTTYCFLNNKLIGAAVNTATYTCMGAPLYIGQHAGGYYFNGWLDEVRISKGTSYIDLSNFTTETEEYSTDADTIMLLHMDGADGSTVFEDSASVNKSIVVCGNSKLSTAQYKFGNSSILLDGSGDNLLFGSFSDFEFGSGDFTVECWFKFNSLPTGNAYNTGQYLLSNGPSFADEGFDLILGSTDVVFNLNYYSSTTIRGKYIPDTNWHHIALVRNGNLFYAFIDGYLVGSGYSTESMHSWTNPWCIGRCEATGENTGYFNGYIDEYRISTGISRFVPGSITVPSEQYSDDTYTKLLLHMDGADESTTFTDSSSSNRTVTRYGTSQIDTDYSVFNGSSGKFGGNGDYLTVPYTADFAFGTDDFTIDCWIRMNAMPTSDAWPSNWSSHMSIAGVGTYNAGDGCNLILGQTQLILQSNDSFFVRGTHGISTGAWHHVAVCRSGNYFFLFVDGNLIGGAQSSVAMGTGSAVYIGCETGQGAWFNGWIDELRISKGVARWTSSFSAPNAFYTPDSHTKLLLHGEGENNSTSIVDSSESGNYVKNIGSTQIDTAQYKFNNASTYFDGGASGLYALHTQEFDFASNDFTIDFWIRANAVGQGNNTNLFSIFDNQTQVSQLVLGLGAGTYNITIWMSTTGSSWDVLSGATLVTLTQNVWAHIMVCRNNSTLYCYKDGVLSGARYIGAVSLYVPPANRSVWVGSGNYSGCYFNGWLDEFRVSSIARKLISMELPAAEYEMSISTYLKAYSEPVIKTECSYSLKGVATQTTSLNKTLTRTISTPINLTGHAYIIGKIRASRTGSNIKIGFHDSGGTIAEVTPNVTSADTWQLIQFDISGVSDANKDAIDQIIITVVNADADNTFYLDNFFAVTAADYALGIQASKVVAYAVLTPIENALSVSKVVAYAVLTPIENALNVSKVVAYAVLGPYVEPQSGSGPMMWIF